VSQRAPKYVFVTGGVVSALGKGIVAASLGRLLKARGLQVQLQKFDPYLNVDPGTMSPFQHGEVFVTEDGAETDLDIGHYERFVDENSSRNSSHSAGAVWETVLRKERKGEFLGATVQVIPHITNEIKARIRRAEEVALALLAQDGVPDRARAVARAAEEVLVHEPLVVADVEVGLGPVLGHEDLAVLERAHRPGVDVEVRIELLELDAKAARFEQPTERCSDDAFPERRDDSTRDKDVLRGPCAHGISE
jgi:hypothetical protein